MNIEINAINPQETYKLRQQVMWPDKPLEFVMLPNDEEGLHFGLWKDFNLISVVSLFITNNQAQFRKFATTTSEQGNGYGTLLLEHLMAVAAQEKVERLWCNARVDKASFYEKFGLVQTSKKFTRAGIDYVVMESIFTIG